MKNTMINILVFTAGAAIGSLVTWKLVKTKYERIAQEEIDSVKETWARRNKRVHEDSNDERCCGTPEDEEDPEEEYDPAVLTDYAALTRRYTGSSGNDTNEEGGGDDHDPIDDAIPGPYVIEPGEFGNGNFDHELHCITYYADHVLADDWWNVLDIEETIGEEALDHFGDFTEDVVHVRNERLRRDYEVVNDIRRFAEVVAENPLAPTYGR